MANVGDHLYIHTYIYIYIYSLFIGYLGILFALK